MESVFRVTRCEWQVGRRGSFNPWFNGICIQGQLEMYLGHCYVSFNPWFNGICIQGRYLYPPLLYLPPVSILGLMESVFRALVIITRSSVVTVSILGLMESVFRGMRYAPLDMRVLFQSLV